MLKKTHQVDKNINFVNNKNLLKYEGSKKTISKSTNFR